MKSKKPPTINAADLRLIREALLPIQRELSAINRRLSRLEQRRPSVLIGGKEEVKNG